MGGLQYIQFNPDESVFVEPIICSPKTKRFLQDRLLLLYTGTTRSTDTILREQSANIARCQDQRQALQDMTRLAHALRETLNREDADVDVLGDILHEGWMMKRGLASGVSNARIDEWYERARRAGARGGKILGAGTGGFLLLYAHPEEHDAIRATLPALRPVPFSFEPQGSKIVFIEEGRG